MLVATQGFANLGIGTPDYIVPDGFLFINGGTVDFPGMDSLTYAALPTGGTSSLSRSGTIGVNSPTNFAGVTGTIQGIVISGTDGPDNLVGTAENNVISGGGGNDTIDGGAGADTAVYSGARAGYTIPGAASGTVTGPDGTDTLTSIERYQFSDRKLAFDLGLNTAGGNTVRIIGAAFDAPTIQQHPNYVGIGLSFFDSGMSMQAVCQLVIGVMGNPTNVAFVNTVYQNVVGVLPSVGVRDSYVGLLVGSIGGTMTQAQLLELAANAEVNAEMNINLVGLQQGGVEFV